MDTRWWYIYTYTHDNIHGYIYIHTEHKKKEKDPEISNICGKPNYMILSNYKKKSERSTPQIYN